MVSVTRRWKGLRDLGWLGVNVKGQFCILVLFRAGNMTHWVKSWLCRHENLSSDLQHLVKAACSDKHLVLQRPGAEIKRFRGSLATSIAHLESFRVGEGPCLKR